MSLFNYPMSVVHYPTSAFHHPMSVFHYSMSVFQYPMSVFHYSMAVFHFSMSVVHYPISIVHCPLSFVHCKYIHLIPATMTGASIGPRVEPESWARGGGGGVWLDISLVQGQARLWRQVSVFICGRSPTCQTIPWELAAVRHCWPQIDLQADEQPQKLNIALEMLEDSLALNAVETTGHVNKSNLGKALSQWWCFNPKCMP